MALVTQAVGLSVGVDWMSYWVVGTEVQVNTTVFAEGFEMAVMGNGVTGFCNTWTTKVGKVKLSAVVSSELGRMPNESNRW